MYSSSEYPFSCKQSNGTEAYTEDVSLVSSDNEGGDTHPDRGLPRVEDSLGDILRFSRRHDDAVVESLSLRGGLGRSFVSEMLIQGLIPITDGEVIGSNGTM
jgi:hypothetical protein